MIHSTARFARTAITWVLMLPLASCGTVRRGAMQGTRGTASVVVLVLSLSSCHTLMTRETTTRSAAEQVLLLSRTYDEATLRGDSAALREILADDYLYVSSRGKVSTKADALAWTQSGAYRLDSGVSDEVQVRV